jgi:CubicO group peptidase (beta-lactamase class C family)
MIAKKFKSIVFILLVLFSLRTVAQTNSYFTKSTPETEGISSAAILSFIEKAEKEIDAIHSFIILRHGKLVSQGWWDPYDAETPHTMHSLSKSFTSTAIGMLVDEGKLTLNDRVFSFFPEYAPPEMNYKQKEMRIRDLLTMNTGHINEPQLWGGGDNWEKTFIEAEVDLNPGTHFKYNSSATYMLSAILQKVTGEKLVDYLEPRLFQPLQIKKHDWDTSPSGVNTGGWGLNIVTEDIAKLGQLYLQKGMWEGKRILSQEWVEMATAKQVSNGSDPDNDWNQGYGFQFWRCRHNAYRGDGAMGQFCIVIPDQDAVVAITSGTSNMPGILNLVYDLLLPAMREGILPPDQQAFSALKQKTAGLKLKPIEGESRSLISGNISNKSYRVSKNQLGVKSITFSLDKGKHSIEVEMENSIETIQIGSGEFVKGELISHLPYIEDLGRSIASSGAWTELNEYKLRIYLYETPARITYTFRFQDDELIWESKLENSLFGSSKQEQLTGKQAK